MEPEPASKCMPRSRGAPTGSSLKRRRPGNAGEAQTTLQDTHASIAYIRYRCVTYKDTLTKHRETTVIYEGRRPQGSTGKAQTTFATPACLNSIPYATHVIYTGNSYGMQM